jgi:hypothetical protein
MFRPIFSFSRKKDNLIYRDLFLAMASITFLLESVIFILILNQTFSLLGFICAHSLVVLGLILYIYYWEQYDNETYFPFLFTLSTTVFGALGALFVLLLLLIRLKVPRVFKTPTADLYDSLLSELKKTEKEELSEYLLSGNVKKFNNSSVIPFMDVLRYGNQRQKQTLIPLLINNYHRNFAPVLREAIQDKDSSIRVLASMGMAQIENQFMEQAIKIEAKKGKGNESDKKYLKILGRHYDDYAHSEILDEVMQTDFRNLAIKSYVEYLHSNPLDGDVLFWLARALLRNGKPEDAAIKFEVALKNKLLLPHNFVWYLESLYRLQKYKKLRDVANKYVRHLNIAEGVIPSEMKNIINTWSPC